MLSRFSNNGVFIRVWGAFLLTGVSVQAQASIWMEVGDAGDSLVTANMTTGTDFLDAIVGTLTDDDPNNVDMYALNIPDLSLFSATTNNLDTELFDSWLYLFDGTGMGVAASATSVGGFTNATISQGSVSGTPGLYYLAITRFETAPESAGGFIFPDLFFDSTNGEVLDPTGPGGGSPLSGWRAPPLFDFENYRIDLVGAMPASNGPVVPEPASRVIWTLTAFVGLAVTFGRQWTPRTSAW